MPEPITEFKAQIDTIMRGFEEFKSAHTASLAKKADAADVVNTEKFDKMLADLEGMKSAFNEKIAEIGRSGRGQGDDEAREESKRASYIAQLEAKAEETLVRKGPDAAREAYAFAAKEAARLEAKDLSTVFAEDGGYMVRPEFAAEMVEIIEDVSDFRQLANVVETGSREYITPVDKGGFEAAWGVELQERTKTATGKIEEIRIANDEIWAFPRVSQVMLEDAAFSVEDWMTKKATKAIARAEGKAFINGDGVAKPKGILSYTTVANASWAWGKIGYFATGKAGGFKPAVAATGGNPSEQGFDTLIDVCYGLHKDYRDNATWAGNRRTLAEIRKIKDVDGNYIVRDAVTESGILSKVMGYDFAELEDWPDITDGAFALGFGDFEEAYTISDRVGLLIKRDDLTEMGFVKVYFRRRVGGGMVDFQALKLVKFATS